jgi:hypothetical protein
MISHRNEKMALLNFKLLRSSYKWIYIDVQNVQFKTKTKTWSLDVSQIKILFWNYNRPWDYSVKAEVFKMNCVTIPPCIVRTKKVLVLMFAGWRQSKIFLDIFFKYQHDMYSLKMILKF